MESAFEVDGPHYFTVLALHILPPEKWRATRVEILRRLLVTSQARAVAPGGATRSGARACSQLRTVATGLLAEATPQPGSPGAGRRPAPRPQDPTWQTPLSPAGPGPP